MNITDMVYSPQDWRLRLDVEGSPINALVDATKIADAVLGAQYVVVSIDAKLAPGDDHDTMTMKIVFQKLV